jgi:uncharacterized protein YjgD (DUF1641 family)
MSPGERGSEEIAAIETLIDIAVKLKESGLLDILKLAAERSEELIAYVSNDTGLMRSLAVADAAMNGLRNLDPGELSRLKKSVEESTECLLEALSKTSFKSVEPKGTLSLLGALRDENVRRGLTILVELARNLGASCTGSKEQTGGQQAR